MLFKGSFLLVIFTVIYGVASKGDSNNQVRSGKVVESRYQFNHPPSAEYNNPVPVAIVYEDDSDYSGRSEILTDLNKSKEKETIKENVQTVTEKLEITTSTTVSNIDSKTKVKLVPKPRTLNNLQIPVTVVYESDSNSHRNYQRTKTDTNTETVKRRPDYSKQLQTKSNSDIQQEENTKNLKVDPEKPEAIPDTRTFKKRTEGRSPVVPILESENYVFSHRGNFHYRYEGGDGTKAYSEGKTDENDNGESVVGGFSYTDKDGNDFNLTYTADENGYRPVGAHLPTPPPIPPAIARALAYLATATPEPVTKRPEKSKTLVA